MYNAKIETSEGIIIKTFDNKLDVVIYNLQNKEHKIISINGKTAKQINKKGGF